MEQPVIAVCEGKRGRKGRKEEREGRREGGREGGRERERQNLKKKKFLQKTNANFKLSDL